MSQPPYPFGPPQDPGLNPPVDPYQSAGYHNPGYADPGYADPGYVDPTYQAAGQQPPAGYPPGAGYPTTHPYSGQPYSGGPGYPAAQSPYPGYPGYPPPPPPGNRTTTTIVAVVAALLVLVVVGGIVAAHLVSKSAHPLAGGSTTPAPTVTASAGAGSAASTAHPGDLRDYLVALPAGARECPDEAGTGGKLSLDQAAQLTSNPDQTGQRKAELQQDNFSGGAIRCWSTSDSTTVDLRLYQFGSADDAQIFFDTDIRGTTNGYPSDDVTDVPGVPDAKSFADSTKVVSGSVQVISIGRKDDVVLVVAMAQPAPLKLSAANDLLKQQYDKL